MDEKIKQNNKDMTGSVISPAQAVGGEHKTQMCASSSLLALSERLKKIRYIHKSSVKNYAIEIRKLKKIIALEQSKLTQKRYGS
jgi:hypothetical protein